MKPLPRVTSFTKPYWEAARLGRFVLQRCRRCHQYIYYPRPWCPHCWHTDIEWVDAAGRGRVLTYTVVHQPPYAAYAQDVPYVLAVVRLAEGPQMMGNVLRVDPARMRVDLPVRIVFEDRAEGFRIPQFEPADE